MFYFLFRTERDMRMATKMAVLALLLVAPAGNAKTSQQPCVPKAIEALPHVAGLVVKQTRTRPVPAPILATWKGQSRPLMIDIDIIQDGVEETYSYLCAVTQGSAFVQRTMN
jgi:hypothetical protein